MPDKHLAVIIIGEHGNLGLWPAHGEHPAGRDHLPDPRAWPPADLPDPGPRRVRAVQLAVVSERLTDLLTDRNGRRAELTVPSGSVQPRHLTELHSAAGAGLPAPLAEVIRRSAEPFIQLIVDLGVPRMAFGRTCLIGDAA
jgi:hypothetical protein